MATKGLRHLESFGEVAAEDDPVLDYFLTTDAVDKIASSDVFLVLGRKGSGKTAIVRHFAEGAQRSSSRALNLRQYPWNIHSGRRDRGASAIESYVASWRYLIALELAALALRGSNDSGKEPAKSLKKFMLDNYGQLDPDLGDVLRPGKLHLSKLAFEPTVLGNKLGSIALERSRGDLSLGRELDALSDKLLEAVVQVAEKSRNARLVLHFDELDQGLSQLDPNRREMLVGLILAARSVRAKCLGSKATILPLVYLRSDLWDRLEFSDKNKIGQTLTLTLEWTPESLREVVDRRLMARIGSTWEDVAEPGLMRGSQSKWNHILARTFMRPRDVVAFLNAALREAKSRRSDPLRFTNPDITEARNRYSPYLKRELDDEILAHWQHWEEALQACSAIQTLTFDKDAFTLQYERRRSKKNDFDPDAALAAMYEFSVVGYQRRSGYGGSSWAFDYQDPEAGWDPSATRFKVHLGLKEYAKLKEERK